MSFHAVDTSTGAAVLSFDHDADAWRRLKARHAEHRHLAMPCCRVEAVPHTAPGDIPYFAHKRGHGCRLRPSGNRSLDFRLRKYLTSYGRQRSFKVLHDIPGPGVADRINLLYETPGANLAINIETVPQHENSLTDRQTSLTKAGLRTLWLLVQSHLPVSPELLCARVSEAPEPPGISFRIPRTQGNGTIRTDVAVPDLITAFADNRFHYEDGCIPAAAQFHLMLKHAACPRCGEPTRILCSLDVKTAGRTWRLPAASLAQRPELQGFIAGAFQKHLTLASTDGGLILKSRCLSCPALLHYQDPTLLEPDSRLGSFANRPGSFLETAVASYLVRGWTTS